MSVDAISSVQSNVINWRQLLEVVVVVLYSFQIGSDSISSGNGSIEHGSLSVRMQSTSKDCDWRGSNGLKELGGTLCRTGVFVMNDTLSSWKWLRLQESVSHLQDSSHVSGCHSVVVNSNTRAINISRVTSWIVVMHLNLSPLISRRCAINSHEEGDIIWKGIRVLSWSPDIPVNDFSTAIARRRSNTPIQLTYLNRRCKTPCDELLRLWSDSH
jgi:hypothetical protein